ncbi:hypothetical protein Tco_0686222 [Tanacetum coccineum]
MSSSSKSHRDYSRKYQRAILEPLRQIHGLPPSPPYPPPNNTTPTSPISNNSLSSSSPLQNSTQNLNEIHHLSNLLDINLQQAIKDTNPSPPSLPYIPPPSLDQVNFHSEFCHFSTPITVVTPNAPTPTVEMTYDGFQTMGKKKKKGKSKSNNSSQISGHLVKQNVRYEPKVTTSTPNKGATNLGNASKPSSMKNQLPMATITSTKEGKIKMSNSYATLGDESKENVENVYDDSANLFHSKTGGSSSTFTTAAGYLI